MVVVLREMGLQQQLLVGLGVRVGMALEQKQLLPIS
jgi:hypothetical protein